jgi:glycosyltransferase involved in cell wall biosynthesis
MNKRLKIVWICHFTNDYVQTYIKPYKYVNEFASWVTKGIEEAQSRDDIELHVISPHRWIGTIREFCDRNVFFYFFNSGMPFTGRHWPWFFRLDIYTNFLFNKLIIRHIVNNICPDIIHLHGIENAYYSSSILQFQDKYPILTTIQGFLSLQIPDKLGLPTKRNLSEEYRLLSKLNNFGIRTQAMKDYILNYNPKARFFYHEYFNNIPIISNKVNTDKHYDLLFYARITKEKGIEDLIIALGLIVKIKPEIKLAVIGAGFPEYIDYLKKLAQEQGCYYNIDFKGFLKNFSDIHEVLRKSSIYVLPTLNDTLPGTLIECMLLGIPCIAYSVGGIPEIAENPDKIILVEPGNIRLLSEAILDLLNDKVKQNLYSENASIYASNRWNNTKALDDIISGYRYIININN